MSLLQPTDPDDIAGRLNYACQLGHTAFVEAVIREKGAKNMDLMDKYGSPPLYNACLKNDNPKLVEFLLDKGASVDLRNEDDETPLFIAAYNNRLECMKVLIARGAKINGAYGYYADSPLHVCVRNNFPEAMELLLDNGAQINAKNKHNETALFLACFMNRKFLAITLLMRKAGKTIQNRDGKDCFYIASEKKHKEILAALQASGPAELIELKKRWEAAEMRKEEAPSRRPTWDQVAFQKELAQFGVTEEEAKRKPGPTHPLQQFPKKRKPKEHDPSKPQPLWDSDEDSEEREERLAKAKAADDRVMANYRKKIGSHGDLGGGTGFNTRQPDVRFPRASSLSHEPAREERSSSRTRASASPAGASRKPAAKAATRR
eukprot:Hpha_TRINITY_DN98_c0_g1::TRINITY_DN98_c0_g1_i1::g.110058::m.110058